jgi:hypothetical protein
LLQNSNGGPANAAATDRGLPRKPRRGFAWQHTQAFTGWSCRGCSWVQPPSRFAPGDPTPLQAAKKAFDAHRCHDYRRASMQPESDMNIASEPIAPSE